MVLKILCVEPIYPQYLGIGFLGCFAAKVLKYKWITYLRNILYHTKNCHFLNEHTYTQTSSMQDLAVILL